MALSLLLAVLASTSGPPAAIELDWGAGRVCTAALIAPTVALTAAHCALPTLPVARQGDRVEAVLAIEPSGAWAGAQAHDVAVVMLGGPLDSPLAVPEAPVPFGWGEAATYAGFGAPHAGEARELRATNGTRQWCDVAARDGAIRIGDSGAPVVRTSRPTELVGLVTAVLPGVDGGVVTTFDATDLAFIRGHATEEPRRWPRGAGVLAVALASLLLWRRARRT